jgi:hypothetical protein
MSFRSGGPRASPAVVGHAVRQCLDQAEASIGRLQQNRAAIRARVRLIERRDERAIEQVGEENSLWYRVVVQQRRLRVAKVLQQALCTTRRRFCFCQITSTRE